jgi:hypothetical protein
MSSCGEIWFKIIGCDSDKCGNRTRIRDRKI